MTLPQPSALLLVRPTQLLFVRPACLCGAACASAPDQVLPLVSAADSLYSRVYHPLSLSETATASLIHTDSICISSRPLLKPLELCYSLFNVSPFCKPHTCMCTCIEGLTVCCMICGKKVSISKTRLKAATFFLFSQITNVGGIICSVAAIELPSPEPCEFIIINSDVVKRDKYVRLMFLAGCTHVKRL